MTSKIAAFNPFRGQASLVLRKLLTSRQDSWTGEGLAQELGISRPWCNKVLNALEKEGIVKRGRTGLAAFTRLVEPEELIKQWQAVYRWGRNTFHGFVHKDSDALRRLADAAEREGWQYAATGVTVLRLRSKADAQGPDTVFVSPAKRGYTAYRSMLITLQEKYSFHRVLNNPDILVVNPVLGRSVYHDSVEVGHIQCVSALQLELDLHGREIVQ